MENNLEKFSKKIKIDWERLDEKNAKPYERIAIQVYKILSRKHGADQDFNFKYLIEKDINENYSKYEEALKNNHDPENAEKKRAEKIVERIDEQLIDKAA